MKRLLRIQLKPICLVTILSISATNSAQWKAVSLHEPELERTSLRVAGPGTHYGRIVHEWTTEAVFWDGASNSLKRYTPHGADDAGVSEDDGTTQVGGVSFRTDEGLQWRAAIWHGVLSPWIDLTPMSGVSAGLDAFYGSTQVGIVWAPGALSHASIWNGTKESWRDVHPQWALGSGLSDISSLGQVGYLYLPWPSQDHAGYWRGTADSCIDLNPPGATMSGATAITSTYQAGYARFGDRILGGLWHGTPESFVDLTPTHGVHALVKDAVDEYQVGMVEDAMVRDHAALWKGSKDSFVDLHRFLPAEYGYSIAHSVYVHGQMIYVGGEAVNYRTGVSEAILWTHPVPELGTGAAVLFGLLFVGGFRFLFEK